MYLRMRKYFDTKLFLWSLFLVQLLLIGIFIIFGSLIINATNDDVNGYNVKFINNTSLKNWRYNQLTPKLIGPKHLKIYPISNFSDYYEVTTQLKNGSVLAKHERVCYREGQISRQVSDFV
jgi:hypothetical protein